MMLKAGEAAKLIYISRPAGGEKKDLIPYIYMHVFFFGKSRWFIGLFSFFTGHLVNLFTSTVGKN